MADPMTANPQQTRLIVTSRLLGELTAQQTQIVRLLRSLRLGQSNPSGDQQWKPPGRTNGHRTPCAGSAAAMPDARVRTRGGSAPSHEAGLQLLHGARTPLG